MKDYIARFGHGSAKLAAQAKSKEKTLARMQEKGLTEAVTDDKVITFRFPDPGPLSSPVCQFVRVTLSPFLHHMSDASTGRCVLWLQQREAAESAS